VIQIRNLSISFGAEPVLRDISLDVQPGECILISGPSGCGKSTLAHSICGLIPHSIPARVEGSIRVAGLDTMRHPVPKLAQKVGFVFQNPASQLFHLRVEDEVAFGARNLGLDESEVRRRADWALEATGLTSLRDQKPAELSGGQKQCLAIAAVLAMRPQILVLDEPTASLDIPSTQRVMETLSLLQEKQAITIILIEHRLAEAMWLANRALIMDKGRVIAEGNPGGIFADQSICKRLGLRRPADEPLTEWDALIQSNGRPRGDSTPLLSLDNVSAGYNHKAVIHDVDLAIHPGDFSALVGDNGAGKSTLALVAAGLLKPSRGNVRYSNGNRPRAGLDIALLFQDPREQLFTDTVDEEVAFGPYNSDCFESSKHLQILEAADLHAYRYRRPTTLSIGQQQRTTLAACLALRPRLVILDEPTLGQDWGHMQKLMDFLTHLNRQGTAILLITHDYKLVHRYARQVFLMDSGRIVLGGKINRGLK